MTTNAAPRTEVQERIELAAVKDLLIRYLQANAASDEPHEIIAIETMLDMAADQDWALPEERVREIFDNASLLCDSFPPRQQLPAAIAGLISELRNEINAYREFREFRDRIRLGNLEKTASQTRVSRIDWLESKRIELRNPRGGRLRKIYAIFGKACHRINLAERKNGKRRQPANNAFSGRPMQTSVA